MVSGCSGLVLIVKVLVSRVDLAGVVAFGLLSKKGAPIKVEAPFGCGRKTVSCVPDLEPGKHLQDCLAVLSRGPGIDTRTAFFFYEQFKTYIGGKQVVCA